MQSANFYIFSKVDILSNIQCCSILEIKDQRSWSCRLLMRTNRKFHELFKPIHTTVKSWWLIEKENYDVNWNTPVKTILIISWQVRIYLTSLLGKNLTNLLNVEINGWRLTIHSDVRVWVRKTFERRRCGLVVADTVHRIQNNLI